MHNLCSYIYRLELYKMNILYKWGEESLEISYLINQTTKLPLFCFIKENPSNVITKAQQITANG